MATVIFHIPQMDCPTEEKMIKNHLNSLPGILELDFNLIQQELKVTYQDVEIAAIQKALTSIGMKAEIKNGAYTAKSLELLQSNVNYRDWIILGISGVLAIVAEVFAYITHAENSPLIIMLALSSILIGGRSTVIKGIKAVRYFTLNMNFLMTIAIIGAMIIGEWPEAAMVTFLFALAEMIESYSLDKARHAIRQLMEITPDVATVKTSEGAWQVKAVNEIQLNNVIWVKPGERIPIDGIVTKGQSSVNQAPITGESIPVEKTEGDSVFAGSINERGSFEFKVTAEINETLISKIIKAVQQAQSERAPTQRFVDQFAKYYTPIMVILAILVATMPSLLFSAPFYPWFYKALVLLVIACPCALVISTPVTIVSGLAAGAKHGVLIKGGTYLELGHKIKAIAFDKTGTLTIGKPIVTDIVKISDISENTLLHLTASLESHSEHPVAEAILNKWKNLSAKENLLRVEKFETIPGRGIIGNIDGYLYFLGNHRFAEEKNVCNAKIESTLKQLEQEGKTTIVLGNQEKVLGILGVTDTLRETSAEAVNWLHKLGITTAMITGDNPTTAKAIAKMVGIDDVQANLLPQDKLAAMDILLKKYDAVGMVGDGINDAPALAKASIGFAMGHAGTDVALETADVALMEDNLTKLPFFIALSRRTWRKLVENISLSIGIKAIFFVLALFGFATLWMAVFADMGASLLVVFNGLRLLRFNSPTLKSLIYGQR
ncbi:MAG: heavy metal translocating P-type ATPase [Gammaproteobacteria bacterium]|nr:heavy metal translocating P-type ATPase [Gammaproteobacteria bacterium]